MTGKNKSLTGRGARLQKESNADGRDQREQEKYTDPADTFQPFSLDTYGRNVRRACIDAYMLLKDFPSKLRFSYYVDRNGCLRCTREQGGQR